MLHGVNFEVFCQNLLGFASCFSIQFVLLTILFVYQGLEDSLALGECDNLWWFAWEHPCCCCYLCIHH